MHSTLVTFHRSTMIRREKPQKGPVVRSSLGINRSSDDLMHSCGVHRSSGEDPWRRRFPLSYLKEYIRRRSPLPLSCKPTMEKGACVNEGWWAPWWDR